MLNWLKRKKKPSRPGRRYWWNYSSNRWVADGFDRHKFYADLAQLYGNDPGARKEIIRWATERPRPVTARQIIAEAAEAEAFKQWARHRFPFYTWTNRNLNQEKPMPNPIIDLDKREARESNGARWRIIGFREPARGESWILGSTGQIAHGCWPPISGPRLILEPLEPERKTTMGLFKGESPANNISRDWTEWEILDDSPMHAPHRGEYYKWGSSVHYQEDRVPHAIVRPVVKRDEYVMAAHPITGDSCSWRVLATRPARPGEFFLSSDGDVILWEKWRSNNTSRGHKILATGS